MIEGICQRMFKFRGCPYAGPCRTKRRCIGGEVGIAQGGRDPAAREVCVLVCPDGPKSIVIDNDDDYVETVLDRGRQLLTGH